MTRAERRRLEKSTKKEATYNLTASQIQQIKTDATNEALDTALILLLGLPVLVIHDYYPQLMRKTLDGQSREERFTELLLGLYESFEKGNLPLDEVKDALKEECGIDIQERRKRH